MDGLTFWDEWAKPPIFLTKELPLALPEPAAAPVWCEKRCGSRSLQQWSVRSSKNASQFHLLNIPTLMAIIILEPNILWSFYGVLIFCIFRRSRPCAPNPSGLGYPPVAPHGHCAQCHDAPAIGHVLRQLPGFCSSHNFWKWRLKLHILVGRCDALP